MHQSGLGKTRGSTTSSRNDDSLAATDEIHPLAVQCTGDSFAEATQQAIDQLRPWGWSRLFRQERFAAHMPVAIAEHLDTKVGLCIAGSPPTSNFHLTTTFPPSSLDESHDLGLDVRVQVRVV